MKRLRALSSNDGPSTKAKSIQDDVNPFTGELVGAETIRSKIEKFEDKIGKYTEGVKSIDIKKYNLSGSLFKVKTNSKGNISKSFGAL